MSIIGGPRDMGQLIAAVPRSGQMAVNSPARPQQSPPNGQNTHLYRWTYLYLCAEYFQVRWEYIAAQLQGCRALRRPLRPWFERLGGVKMLNNGIEGSPVDRPTESNVRPGLVPMLQHADVWRGIDRL